MQARPAARTRCAPDHTALSGSHRSPCHDLGPFPVGPFPRTQEVRSPGMPAARLPGNSTYDNPRQGRTPDTGGCLVFLTSLTRRPGRLVPCWSRPGPCVRKNAKEPPAMAGGELPGVPGDKQPPTPGCRGAPFGYFPNLVKYQGGAGASGDTRHLAATTTSPSGWRTCATPCFGSAESTWRLRLRHLPACQRGRAGSSPGRLAEGLTPRRPPPGMSPGQRTRSSFPARFPWPGWCTGAAPRRSAAGGPDLPCVRPAASGPQRARNVA